MTARAATLKALLTVTLLTAVTLLCLSDLVMAAMPQDDRAACLDLLCDRQSACGVPIGKTVGLPAATPAAEPTIAVPLSVTVASAAVEVPAAVRRQVVTLAPRSPPLA